MSVSCTLSVTDMKGRISVRCTLTVIDMKGRMSVSCTLTVTDMKGRMSVSCITMNVNGKHALVAIPQYKEYAEFK